MPHCDFGDTVRAVKPPGGHSALQTIGRKLSFLAVAVVAVLLFVASGVAALEARGLVDKVTHVSSVSAGGLPAAYLAVHRKKQCTQAQTGPHQANCLTADFATLQPKLTRDFSNAMLWRQAWRPDRWFHPSERITSLEEVFHQHITDGGTLADLPDHPVFLFNTVSYDTGSTFVMSNVALYDPQDAPQALLDPRLRTSSFSAPGCARRLPAETSLALAVASSAAFPALYGPGTLSKPQEAKDPNAEAGAEFVHLGDDACPQSTRDRFDTMRAYLARIPTGFSITDCDTEMMRRAAEQLVETAIQKGGPLAALAEN